MSSKVFWTRDQWAAANAPLLRTVASPFRTCRIEGCGALAEDGDLCDRCREEIEAFNKWHAEREAMAAEKAFIAHRKELAAAERELREDRIRLARLYAPEQKPDPLTWVLVGFAFAGLCTMGWIYGAAFIEWLQQ